MNLQDSQCVEPQVKEIKCDKCDGIFIDRTAFAKHAMKPFHCKRCKKAYSSKNVFDQHCLRCEEEDENADTENFKADSDIEFDEN
jgi:hypothetical protein